MLKKLCPNCLDLGRETAYITVVIMGIREYHDEAGRKIQYCPSCGEYLASMENVFQSGFTAPLPMLAEAVNGSA